MIRIKSTQIKLDNDLTRLAKITLSVQINRTEFLESDVEFDLSLIITEK